MSVTCSVLTRLSEILARDFLFRLSDLSGCRSWVVEAITSSGEFEHDDDEDDEEEDDVDDVDEEGDEGDNEDDFKNLCRNRRFVVKLRWRLVKLRYVLNSRLLSLFMLVSFLTPLSRLNERRRLGRRVGDESGVEANSGTPSLLSASLLDRSFGLVALKTLNVDKQEDLKVAAAVAAGALSPGGGGVLFEKFR